MSYVSKGAYNYPTIISYLSKCFINAIIQLTQKVTKISAIYYNVWNEFFNLQYSVRSLHLRAKASWILVIIDKNEYW